MLRHHENLYKTINITYHGKFTPYPLLSSEPYDCPLCPVKGLYHEMRSIVIACRGDRPRHHENQKAKARAQSRKH